MFHFLLKKQAWHWCCSQPLLNKPGVQGLIQQLIRKLVRLSLQSFACLDVVGEFQDLVLVLACIYQRLPNSKAKFVPFSPLSKHEIIISLSLIERTDRFCFVDMSFWVIIVFCVYITHAHCTDQAWHSLCNKHYWNNTWSKFSWTHQNAFVAEHSILWKQNS